MDAFVPGASGRRTIVGKRRSKTSNGPNRNSVSRRARDGGRPEGSTGRKRDSNDRPRGRRSGRRSEREVVAEIADDISSLAERLVRDGAAVADMKLMHATLREMKRAFDVFSKYSHIRKVSTFGSARTPADSPQYAQAREFSRRMADAGYMVITGAGPGIMQACNEGSGRDRSFGINIRLPFEQSANKIIHNDPKLVTFKYFFTRKLMFVKEADAIVLFPGGFGTHDEGFESLTLMQTGKAKPLPVVFIDAPGGTYWKSWQRYVKRHLRDEGLISEADMSLFRITDDIDVAIREIQHFYSRYHSQRYVGDRLILRLNGPIRDETLAELNEEFGDLVASGRITQRIDPREEDHPPASLEFHSSRRNFGRLRLLIDRINDD